MAQWHDVTPETGNPSDLPRLCDDKEYIVTIETITGEIGALVFSTAEMHNCMFGYLKDNPKILAWRKMPKPYVPGKPRERRKWHDLQKDPNDLPPEGIFTVEVWLQDEGEKPRWCVSNSVAVVHGDPDRCRFLKWRYPPEWKE